MPRLLLLIPTQSYRAPDFLAAAERLGVDLVVGTDRCRTVAEACEMDELALPTRDPAAAASRIVELAQERPLSAIVAAEDATVAIAARASEALGLRHNPVAAAEASRDKRRLRARLDEAGLPQPLTLSPPIAGTGEWLNTSIFQFKPDAPLPGGQTFSARVEAGLEDTTGGLMEEAFAWQFTTLPPAVVEVSPESGAIDVGLDEGGFEAKHFGIPGHGLLELSLPHQGISQVVLCFCMFRV